MAINTGRMRQRAQAVQDEQLAREAARRLEAFHETPIGRFMKGIEQAFRGAIYGPSDLAVAAANPRINVPALSLREINSFGDRAAKALREGALRSET